MDIFSLLPIIIMIFAVASAVNKGMTGIGRRPFNPPPASPPAPIRSLYQAQRSDSPMSQGLRSSSRELSPLARGPVPALNSVAKQQELAQASGQEGAWGDEGRPAFYGSAAPEISDRDFLRGGSFSSEGISGDEGTAGTEGMPGIEGTFGKEGTPEARNIDSVEQIIVATDTSGGAGLRWEPGQANLLQGVIWAEILGKPRAMRQFRSRGR